MQYVTTANNNLVHFAGPYRILVTGADDVWGQHLMQKYFAGDVIRVSELQWTGTNILPTTILNIETTPFEIMFEEDF